MNIPLWNIRHGKAVTIGLTLALIIGAWQGALAAGYKMKIEFPGYTNRTDTLTNFPVLVALSNNVDGSGFSFEDTPFLSDEGWDLRFRDTDEITELNYEIESWDTNASSYVWVQVPELPADGSGYIWAYWGEDDMQQACTTNGAVWSNAYVGVWHLSETNGTHADSTDEGNDGTINNNVDQDAAGMVDGANDFAGGQDDIVEIDGTASSFEFADNTYSISAWIRPDFVGDDIAVVDNYDGSDGFRFRIDNGKIKIQHTGAFVGDGPSGGELALDSWQHVSATVNGDSASVFINGEAEATDDIDLYTQANKPIAIGGRTPGSDSSIEGLQGRIDEVRFSEDMWSTDWIWADYMTVASNTVFSDYGTVTPLDEDAAFITTVAASGFATNGATLNGTLTSTGLSVTAVSVFWEESSEDQGTNTTDWTNEESFGDYTGSLPNDFATNITGLAADETYTYRYYATNDAGEAWGAAESFTTYEAPAIPTIDAPSETGFVHMVISGAVNGGNPDPLAYFCLNVDDDGGTGGTSGWDIVESAGVQSGAFTNTITGLEDDTLYYARVYVTNEVGEAWSEDINFTTEATPAQLTVDGDQTLDGGEPVIRFEETTAALAGGGAAPDWTFDFSFYGEAAIPVNWAGHTLTYERPDQTDRGTITFNMNGGAISNAVAGVTTNGLSLQTLPRSQVTYTDRKYSDSIFITNCTGISMGGVDTSATSGIDNRAYGGNISIGTDDDPVSGNIRIDSLRSHAGVYGESSAYAEGGSVNMYGEGDVIIADHEGEAGDIMAWSSRGSANDNIVVQHQGSFTAGALDTSIFSGGSGHRAGNMAFDGGSASGDFTAAYIKANYHGGNYTAPAPSISIANYDHVAITGVIESVVYQNVDSDPKYTRDAGNVTINTGISGDITIGDVIDLTTFDLNGDYGTLRLACTGTVTLASLDLDKVRWAELSSGGKKSYITGSIGNFDVTESATSGTGSTGDPKIPENETRLRAPAGQVVYYEYSDGLLNDYLGGDVWQLPNLDNSGNGGLLMVKPPLGTVMIIR